eukprot:SAG11_NODE_6872_length_1233_cov_1.135802_1_plen_137_part_00
MMPRPWPLTRLLGWLLLLAPKNVNAAIDGHRVESLLGWEGPLPSRHYAGHIEITDVGGAPGRQHWPSSSKVATLTLASRGLKKTFACVDADPNPKKLFYWFVEAEQCAPADAPVVLWTNGGPGSDSLGQSPMHAID